eukprot:TRINITY_DN934_c0_g1_i1.p1 TRINITY_DN934_c0_g1~~TRINITY_DN934_c0_g1_i1.p1  ORF type:complete len:315 (+),score=44.98 TRINITY_DN934_c0_g1_i1:269-1213(+)
MGLKNWSIGYSTICLSNLTTVTAALTALCQLASQMHLIGATSAEAMQCTLHELELVRGSCYGAQLPEPKQLDVGPPRWRLAGLCFLAGNRHPAPGNRVAMLPPDVAQTIVRMAQPGKYESIIEKLVQVKAGQPVQNRSTLWSFIHGVSINHYSKLLSIKGTTITYRMCKFTLQPVGCCQVDRSCDECHPFYFEAHVNNLGAHGTIGIGFAHRNYPSTAQPGWRVGSAGYHGDDGAVFCAEKVLATCETWNVGDTIGCGYKDGAVFWTRNGVKLTVVAHLHSSAAEPLLPTIGMHSANESVTLNFGPHFSFTPSL